MFHMITTLYHEWGSLGVSGSWDNRYRGSFCCDPCLSLSLLKYHTWSWLKAFAVFQWYKFDQPAQEQIMNIPPFQQSHSFCSLHKPPSIIFPFIFLLPLLLWVPVLLPILFTWCVFVVTLQQLFLFPARDKPLVARSCSDHLDLLTLTVETQESCWRCGKRQEGEAHSLLSCVCSEVRKGLWLAAQTRMFH